MTMRRDSYNNTVPSISITPRVVTSATTVTGTAVDLRDCGSALVVAATGDLGSQTSVTFNVEHSADGTTWAAAPARDLVSDTGQNGWAKGVSTTGTVASCAYIGSRRYIRVKAQVAGSSPSAYIAALVVGGKLRIEGH